MRLQILNVTQEDLGKYSCKAKNSLGETDGEITLYGKTIPITYLCVQSYSNKRYEQLQKILESLVLIHRRSLLIFHQIHSLFVTGALFQRIDLYPYSPKQDVRLTV